MSLRRTADALVLLAVLAALLGLASSGSASPCKKNPDHWKCQPVEAVEEPTDPSAAPENETPPEIGGTPQVGQTLAASNGSWSASPTSYAYQWLRCSSADASCSSIGGAAAASYLLENADVGATLRVVVTASNQSGSADAASAPTEIVVEFPPVNTSPPVISGTAQVGRTLSASAGSWSGSPTSYAYQWLRCNSAGNGCSSISGATAAGYLLASADEGATLRVVVTASNASGSASATSAQTAVVAAATPPSSYPASYYAGPLGQRNILPPKHPGAFLGIWDTDMQQALDREAYIGRKFDIHTAMYNAAAGECYNYTPFADGKSQKQVEHGAIPLVNWSPGFTLDEINAGKADHCFRDVAQRAKAFGHLFYLRIYHEHNGTWMRYSGCGEKFISAWRRSVSIFRAEGAGNVAWVWSVSEGHRNCAFESYPGDEWVDWVSTGGYNHNKSTAWCGYHAGWCEFWEIFRYDPAVSLHDRYGPRKPIMFNETGTVEDTGTPGRKGHWFRLARDKMKSDFAYGKALVYFDIKYTDGDWRLDTTTSSLQGFRDLARDPHFRTRE